MWQWVLRPQVFYDRWTNEKWQKWSKTKKKRFLACCFAFRVPLAEPRFGQLHGGFPFLNHSKTIHCHSRMFAFCQRKASNNRCTTHADLPLPCSNWLQKNMAIRIKKLAKSNLFEYTNLVASTYFEINSFALIFLLEWFVFRFNIFNELIFKRLDNFIATQFRLFLKLKCLFFIT